MDTKSSARHSEKYTSDVDHEQIAKLAAFLSNAGASVQLHRTESNENISQVKAVNPRDESTGIMEEHRLIKDLATSMEEHRLIKDLATKLLSASTLPPGVGDAAVELSQSNDPDALDGAKDPSVAPEGTSGSAQGKMDKTLESHDLPSINQTTADASAALQNASTEIFKKVSILDNHATPINTLEVKTTERMTCKKREITEEDAEHSLVLRYAATLADQKTSRSTSRQTSTDSNDLDPVIEFYETQKRLFLQLQRKNLELRRMIAQMKAEQRGQISKTCFAFDGTDRASQKELSITASEKEENVVNQIDKYKIDINEKEEENQKKSFHRPDNLDFNSQPTTPSPVESDEPESLTPKSPLIIELEKLRQHKDDLEPRLLQLQQKRTYLTQQLEELLKRLEVQQRDDPEEDPKRMEQQFVQEQLLQQQQQLMQQKHLNMQEQDQIHQQLLQRRQQILQQQQPNASLQQQAQLVWQQEEHHFTQRAVQVQQYQIVAQQREQLLQEQKISEVLQQPTEVLQQQNMPPPQEQFLVEQHEQQYTEKPQEAEQQDEQNTEQQLSQQQEQVAQCLHQQNQLLPGHYDVLKQDKNLVEQQHPKNSELENSEPENSEQLERQLASEQPQVRDADLPPQAPMPKEKPEKEQVHDSSKMDMSSLDRELEEQTRFLLEQLNCTTEELKMGGGYDVQSWISESSHVSSSITTTITTTENITEWSTRSEPISTDGVANKEMNE